MNKTEITEGDVTVSSYERGVRTFFVATDRDGNILKKGLSILTEDGYKPSTKGTVRETAARLCLIAARLRLTTEMSAARRGVVH